MSRYISSDQFNGIAILMGFFFIFLIIIILAANAPNQKNLDCSKYEKTNIEHVPAGCVKHFIGGDRK